MNPKLKEIYRWALSTDCGITATYHRHGTKLKLQVYHNGFVLVDHGMPNNSQEPVEIKIPPKALASFTLEERDD